MSEPISALSNEEALAGPRRIRNQFEEVYTVFNISPGTVRRNYVVQTCLRHFFKYAKRIRTKNTENHRSISLWAHLRDDELSQFHSRIRQLETTHFTHIVAVSPWSKKQQEELQNLATWQVRYKSCNDRFIQDFFSNQDMRDLFNTYLNYIFESSHHHLKMFFVNTQKAGRQKKGTSKFVCCEDTTSDVIPNSCQQKWGLLKQTILDSIARSLSRALPVIKPTKPAETSNTTMSTDITTDGQIAPNSLDHDDSSDQLLGSMDMDVEESKESDSEMSEEEEEGDIDVAEFLEDPNEPHPQPPYTEVNLAHTTRQISFDFDIEHLLRQLRREEWANEIQTQKFNDGQQASENIQRLARS